jgi:putative lipoic acid-binding regulatory protein
MSNPTGGNGHGKPPAPQGAGGGATTPGGQQVPELTYPTDYAFKVIGRQEADFAGYVRQLFAGLMGTDIDPGSVSEHPSRQGKYVSVEVRVRLESEAQRRSIYARLHQEPRIVLYL